MSLNKIRLLEGSLLLLLWVITPVPIVYNIICGPYPWRPPFYWIPVVLLVSTLMSIFVFAGIYYDTRKEKGIFSASIDYGFRMALLFFTVFFIYILPVDYLINHFPIYHKRTIIFGILLIGSVIITSLFWQLFYIFVFEDRNARSKLDPYIKKLAEIVDIKRIHFFTLNKIWGYNAFAAGIIPLYTIMVTTPLLDLLDEEEMLSALLHEVGHIRERHLRIALVLPLCFSAISIFVFGVLGFLQDQPIALILLILTIALLFFIPFFYFRRVLEVRADRFAVKLNGKEPLISALTKIEQKNPKKIKERSLDSLYIDHPLYKRRIELIENMEGK